MEIGEDKKFSFLDATLNLIDNHIICDWFHKLTFSGRYLNFFSRHPLCQKRGTVIELFDRAFLLSHPIFHIKNIEWVIEILLRNGYPLEFIFQTFHKRLQVQTN